MKKEKVFRGYFSFYRYKSIMREKFPNYALSEWARLADGLPVFVDPFEPEESKCLKLGTICEHDGTETHMCSVPEWEVKNKPRRKLLRKEEKQ